jgi:hypothetical protein
MNVPRQSIPTHRRKILMSKKKDDKDKKGAVVRALMEQWDAKQWKPMFDMLGISDEETSVRLTRLLLMHLMLDRAVTAVLAVRFLDARLMPSYENIEAILAPLDVSTRIDLAKASHLISASCASNIKTVNTVRNKLMHYQPKLGFGVAHVQEISSANAYEQCIEKGMCALREVVDTTIKNMEEISLTR